MRRGFARRLRRRALPIPIDWIGTDNSPCNAFGVDLPLLGTRSGAQPFGSRARRQKPERDGTEQRPVRATHRQPNADARDVLDHARSDLDQALSDRGELGCCERVRLRAVSASYGVTHPRSFERCANCYEFAEIDAPN